VVPVSLSSLTRNTGTHTGIRNNAHTHPPGECWECV
jgi:hypothetical protein